MLGSLFETILTAITDPKDDYAIRIKTDPSYKETTKWKRGRQATTSSGL
jgi:hypothetical protein